MVVLVQVHFILSDRIPDEEWWLGYRQKKLDDLVKESDKEKDLFCVRSCQFCFRGDWCDYDYI